MNKSKIIAIIMFALMGTMTFTYAASSETDGNNELTEVNLRNEENNNEEFYENPAQDENQELLNQNLVQQLPAGNNNQPNNNLVDNEQDNEEEPTPNENDVVEEDTISPVINVLNSELNKNPQLEIIEKNDFKVLVKDMNNKVVRDKGMEKYFGVGYLAEGEYKIVATDELGNTSTKNVTVDKTAPVITKNPLNLFFKKGETFVDPNEIVTGLDNLEGDVTNKIVKKIFFNTHDGSITNKLVDGIDTEVVGKYVINYSLEDAAGNKASSKNTNVFVN